MVVPLASEPNHGHQALTLYKPAYILITGWLLVLLFFSRTYTYTAVIVGVVFHIKSYTDASCTCNKSYVIECLQLLLCEIYFHIVREEHVPFTLLSVYALRARDYKCHTFNVKYFRSGLSNQYSLGHSQISPSNFMHISYGTTHKKYKMKKWQCQKLKKNKVQTEEVVPRQEMITRIAS